MLSIMKSTALYNAHHGNRGKERKARKNTELTGQGTRRNLDQHTVDKSGAYSRSTAVKEPWTSVLEEVTVIVEEVTVIVEEVTTVTVYKCCCTQ